MATMLFLFGSALALVLLNVPIAVALGLVAVVAMVSTHGPDILPNVALVTYGGATNFPLLAIPLFILAGAIMNASGISRRLIAFATALFGWIRGGLAHVSIGSSLFFAEISGSAVADVAALGSIATPAIAGYMSRRASDDQQGELQGLLTSVSAIGMILSPLLMTGTFGLFTAEGTGFYFPGAPFVLSMALVLLSLVIFMGRERLHGRIRST